MIIMLAVRKLFVDASPLRHCMLYFKYSNKSIRKPRVTFGKKKWNAPQVHQNYNFGRNPGVEGQLQALDLTEEEMKDPNILEDMEQQFWNADKVEGTLEREKYIDKELQSIFQVTRKQFKEEKSPNMLSWDEKQQIRALHAKDPEKWTHMQLAFSFPATPSIIQKILRAKWKYNSPEQIEKHDARVQRNWDALLKDDLEVPNEELKKHLLSFSQRRKLISSNMKDIATSTVPPPKTSDSLKNVLKDGGVFANIYKSYKPIDRIEKRDETITEEVQTPAQAGLQMLYQPPQNDTFIIPKAAQNVLHRTNKHLTLEDMKDVVMQDVVKGKSLTGDEINFVQEKLLMEREKSNYPIMKDPIGKEANEEFSRGQEGIDTVSNSSNDLNTTHKITLSVEEINTSDSAKNFRSSQSEDDNVSKFIDVSGIKNIQKLEDKEIIASLRTAKMARSKMDDEIVVKAVKEYVSHSSESYPLEIAIPKDKWKKGALYRVKDRFYTDDGEFLYRVPGISQE
ncbi:uncharacterized protein LOC117652195 [Thrips palmi]|uniref:Uncharacterized protein LOC117652195 n=1 Tax=Thrips palmi TaxID=161013 RepID=A0A6P9A5N8_THRPL|nr:uncharacterized protein LOC117652195 [Thrips palmi]